MISVQPLSLREVAEAEPNLWGLAEPIMYAVCHELDVTPLGVLSEDRHAPLPQARQLVAWMLYRRGWLGRQISQLLGREVSTVYYYLRNIERRRRQEWEMADRCARLTAA